MSWERIKSRRSGFLELSSISRGLFLTDVVLKKAPIRVIASQPISVGQTRSALHRRRRLRSRSRITDAIDLADGTVLKRDPDSRACTRSSRRFWIPSGTSFPTRACRRAKPLESSSRQTLAGAILAADRALKAARRFTLPHAARTGHRRKGVLRSDGPPGRSRSRARSREGDTFAESRASCARISFRARDEEALAYL